MKCSNNILLNMRDIGENLLNALKVPLSWILCVGSYFAPIQGVFSFILLVVAFDFITGLRASHINKIPRSSKRFRKSAEKLFCYLGVVWLFWEFEMKTGLAEYTSAHKFITGFIFLVEIVSILENMAVITGSPMFLKIIKFIRGKSIEKHGSLIEDILEEKNK